MRAKPDTGDSEAKQFDLLETIDASYNGKGYSPRSTVKAVIEHAHRRVADLVTLLGQKLLPHQAEAFDKIVGGPWTTDVRHPITPNAGSEQRWVQSVNTIVDRVVESGFGPDLYAQIKQGDTRLDKDVILEVRAALERLLPELKKPVVKEKTPIGFHTAFASMGPVAGPHLPVTPVPQPSPSAKKRHKKTP